MHDYFDFWTSQTMLNILGCIVTTDLMMNMILLYLQFPFAKQYYEKYCQCFINCWARIIGLRLNKESNVADQMTRSTELQTVKSDDDVNDTLFKD